MVEIETFGLPADTKRSKGAHKTRYQQGPHPKWENPPEEFLFEKVREICFNIVESNNLGFQGSMMYVVLIH